MVHRHNRQKQRMIAMSCAEYLRGVLNPNSPLHQPLPVSESSGRLLGEVDNTLIKCKYYKPQHKHIAKIATAKDSNELPNNKT